MKDRNILTNNGIDVDHGIALLGDMEMYDSMLSDFLNDFVDRINKIQKAKVDVDLENYAILVHSLKSDSKYLGFMKLAELAYQQEMASKANDFTAVTRNHNEMIMEASRIYTIGIQYMNTNLNQLNEQEFNVPSNKAILVADDSSIVRNFVREIFSETYDVLEAENGQEVINIIAQNQDRIATLLLDLNMPEVDGFAVLDYFKQNNLFSAIPVSIISGADDKVSIDRAFTYPIVDMLSKPFNRENVKLTVEKNIHARSQSEVSRRR